MIHKTSVIDKNAKVSKNAKIGPYSVIGPNVEIGDQVEIHSHVIVTGNTKIGIGTKIFPFASIGTEPQDLKYKGETNSLIIGKNNIIREYVTINPGTSGGGAITKIGNNCLFMISSHVAHDCQIGNNVVIRAADHIYKNTTKKINVSGHLGGKITIGNNVWIGANCVILRNVTIKDNSVIGAGTVVTKDVGSNELVISNKQVNLKNI